jgi:arylsulfatase A-like enzyme
MASTKRNWPVGRGFERFYGFLGGETNQWYPDLVYDNHLVEQPGTPEEGYHLTTDLTDRAIEFIKDAKMIAPHKPFFMYFCPGATHAPHHAPKEWIEKYKGRFDMGYEAYRELVFERQKQLGIFPAGAELSPLNPYAEEQSPEGAPWPPLDVVRPWDSLGDDEKRLFCRMAEVYAGFLSHTDHEIGRLLDFLEETGELENTIVVFVSDNGASGEGGPNGSVNENKFFNGIPDTIEENLKHLDDLGSPATYNHYPVGWACAFNTPFKMWKRYNFEGGVADPLLISWPKGIDAKGELRHQFLHATDIVPTIYDLLGIELPEVVKGYQQVPLEGVSFRATFESDDVPTPKETGFFSMLGSRAIWHKGWKAVSVHPTIAGWGNFDRDRWELYNTDEDPTESRDLAAEHPEKVQELINIWFHAAGQYNGLPLLDNTAVEVLADPTRPQVARPLRVLPGCCGGPGVGRGQHPKPQLQHRCRGERRGRRLVRCPLFPRCALRRSRALRQGPEAEVRLQVRRRQGADRRVDEGDPGGTGDARGIVRPRGPLDARDRNPLALHRRREGGGGSDRYAAGQLLTRRGGPQRRQGSRRARDRRLRRHEPVRLHRRRDQGGDRRHLRRALRRSRARGTRDDEAGVIPVALY